MRTSLRTAALIVTILAAIAFATASEGQGLFRSASALKPLEGSYAWTNSPPLSPEALRGKVVLLDFWTYSCINCLRTLPYVRAWAQKYKDHGLVVIGVHTPEFGFERRPQNVQRAGRDLGIDFPVVLDADRAIWTASGVRGWPTLDFIDARGQRRHRQVGEGEYEESERVIQSLLRESGAKGVPTDLVQPRGAGTQAAPAPMPPGSGETYLGAGQARGFAAAQGTLRSHREERFVAAANLAADQWTLGGDWQVEDEYVELRKAAGAVTYRFRARDLHLVLGPAEDGRNVRFRVRIDGQPPGADRGTDVDAAGMGVVDTHRLYQLVRQADPRRQRLFEIEFLDPGVRAYAFTFG